MPREPNWANPDRLKSRDHKTGLLPAGTQSGGDTVKNLVAALMLCAGASVAMADPVLYSNPWDGGVAGGYSSQNDTTGGNGNFATVAGYFNTGGVAWNITDVHFTGVYFNPPAPGVITAFNIQFYSDSGAGPGVPVSPLYNVGAFVETALPPVGGFPYSTYDLNIPSTPFTGSGYIAIFPDMGFPPQWGWAAGTGPDVAYQTFFGSPFAPTATSVAFDLTGTVAPTPGALALLGLGGLVAGRRRR